MLRHIGIAAVLAIIIVSAAQAAPLDWSGFGTLEGRVALTPDPGGFGGGLSLQLTTFPEAWIIIGSHKVFADAVFLSKSSAVLGGSISLAANDNGLRLGAKLSGDREVHWYIARALATW